MQFSTFETANRARTSTYESEVLARYECRLRAERLPASRRRDAIVRYLDEVVLATMPILGYDKAAADWHATERARLMSRGETPAFADGQIAAIAHVNDLSLVTFNDADFRRFHELRVVTW